MTEIITLILSLPPSLSLSLSLIPAVSLNVVVIGQLSGQTSIIGRPGCLLSLDIFFFLLQSLDKTSQPQSAAGTVETFQ